MTVNDIRQDESDTFGQPHVGGRLIRGGGRMSYKIENINTDTWHRVMEDLKAAGFEESYRYDGIDAGIDFSRYELLNRADDELVVFEWDNWTEGEIKATPSRLEALREKYQLPELVEEK